MATTSQHQRKSPSSFKKKNLILKMKQFCVVIAGVVIFRSSSHGKGSRHANPGTLLESKRPSPV